MCASAGDAVDLRELRVHAREAQVAIDEPDPEGRVVEDRVEDGADARLARAGLSLDVEQPGAIERLRTLLRDGRHELPLLGGERPRRVEAEADRAHHALADLRTGAPRARPCARRAVRTEAAPGSARRTARASRATAARRGAPPRPAARGASSGRVAMAVADASQPHPTGGGQVERGRRSRRTMNDGARRPASAPIASVTSTAATSFAVLALESAAVTAWSRATRSPGPLRHLALGALGVEELRALERLRALLRDREEERAFVGVEGARLLEHERRGRRARARAR